MVVGNCKDKREVKRHVHDRGPVCGTCAPRAKGGMLHSRKDLAHPASDSRAYAVDALLCTLLTTGKLR